MRVRKANIRRSPETKCSFSHLSGIGSHSVRRRFESGQPTIVGWRLESFHHMTMMEETLSLIAASVIPILSLTITCHLTWLTMFLRAFLLVHTPPRLHIFEDQKKNSIFSLVLTTNCTRHVIILHRTSRPSHTPRLKNHVYALPQHVVPPCFEIFVMVSRTPAISPAVQIRPESPFFENWSAVSVRLHLFFLT